MPPCSPKQGLENKFEGTVRIHWADLLRQISWYASITGRYGGDRERGKCQRQQTEELGSWQRMQVRFLIGDRTEKRIMRNTTNARFYVHFLKNGQPYCRETEYFFKLLNFHSFASKTKFVLHVSRGFLLNSSYKYNNIYHFIFCVYMSSATAFIVFIYSYQILVIVFVFNCVFFSILYWLVSSCTWVQWFLFQFKCLFSVPNKWSVY